MDINQFKLGKCELQVWECIAWGASVKEVAYMFRKPYRTIENTIRHIKIKLGVQKVNELSALWFCSKFNISVDLSPLAKRLIATPMIIILLYAEIGIPTKQIYVRPNRRTHIEVSLPVRARISDISSS